MSDSWETLEDAGAQPDADRQHEVRGVSPQVLGVALLCLIAVVWATFMSWVSGVGVIEYDYIGLDFPIPVAFVYLGSLVAAVASLRAFRNGSRESAQLAALPAALLATYATSAIIMIEVSVAMLPDQLVPETFHRAGVGVSAGPGLWLMFLASWVCLAALISQGSGYSLRALAKPLVNNKALGTAVLAMSLAGLAFARLRYEPVVTFNAADKSFDLAIWWIPWFGPLSLFASWGILLAAVMLCCNRTEAAAVIGAICGWLVTFMAGVFIIIGQFADGFERVETLIPSQVEEITGTVEIGSDIHTVVWVMFGAGMLAALASSIALLNNSEATIDDEEWGSFSD